MLIAVYERRIDVFLYWNTIFYWVVIRDLVTGVGKSFFFGVIVTLIGAHNGLAMTGGTEGLGRATTATVVQVSVAVIVADFFLTKLFLCCERDQAARAAGAGRGCRAAARDARAPMSLEGVGKAFAGVPVLKGLDLEVSRGSTVTVMGGSGSGKTVLLRLIAGLIKPDRGRIRTLGVDITPLREEALLPIRRRMGFVFQGAALFDSLTVYENVAYPLREHATLPEAEIAERVHRLLARVGLRDDVDQKLPAELSGGMRKRVGIARALVLAPELVLYDEPTAGLDPTNARLITELVGEPPRRRGVRDGDGGDPRPRVCAEPCRTRSPS